MVRPFERGAGVAPRGEVVVFHAEIAELPAHWTAATHSFAATGRNGVVEVVVAVVEAEGEGVVGIGVPGEFGVEVVEIAAHIRTASSLEPAG